MRPVNDVTGECVCALITAIYDTKLLLSDQSRHTLDRTLQYPFLGWIVITWEVFCLKPFMRSSCIVYSTLFRHQSIRRATLGARRQTWRRGGGAGILTQYSWVKLYRQIEFDIGSMWKSLYRLNERHIPSGLYLSHMPRPMQDYKEHYSRCPSKHNERPVHVVMTINTTINKKQRRNTKLERTGYITSGGILRSVLVKDM